MCSDYFKINKHHLGTRNRHIFLLIPEFNLEIAKSCFSFMGAK